MLDTQQLEFIDLLNQGTFDYDDADETRTYNTYNATGIHRAQVLKQKLEGVEWTEAFIEAMLLANRNSFSLLPAQHRTLERAIWFYKETEFGMYGDYDLKLVAHLSSEGFFDFLSTTCLEALYHIPKSLLTDTHCENVIDLYLSPRNREDRWPITEELPEKFLTRELCIELIKRCVSNAENIPIQTWDDAFLRAIIDHQPSVTYYAPEPLITPAIIQHMLENNADNIKFVPEAHRTLEMVLECIDAGAHFRTAYEFIPPEARKVELLQDFLGKDVYCVEFLDDLIDKKVMFNPIEMFVRSHKTTTASGTCKARLQKWFKKSELNADFKKISRRLDAKMRQRVVKAFKLDTKGMDEYACTHCGGLIDAETINNIREHR